jgi:hydroxypyruvate reductase
LVLRPLVLSTLIEGETRDVARMHAAIAREIPASGRPARPPVCLISGGETTVTLRGGGLGGRNQEFVLAAAIDLAGSDGVVVLSGGTDGADGRRRGHRRRVEPAARRASGPGRAAEPGGKRLV